MAGRDRETEKDATGSRIFAFGKFRDDKSGISSNQERKTLSGWRSVA